MLNVLDKLLTNVWTVAVNDQPADEAIIDPNGACASWNIKYITSSQGAFQAAALTPRRFRVQPGNESSH